MIALVALGYSMVYGVLKLINFAHSEIFMMAAYFGLFLVTFFLGRFGVDVNTAHGSMLAILAVVLGTFFAMVGASILGVTVERAAYKPLRGRRKGPLTRITPLVTALGVSVFLQNLAQFLFTARFRPYPHAIERTRPVIFVAAVVVMVVLELVVKYTWYGKAMRALATNEEAARLMGIRTGRVIAVTFSIGSSLAALGAVLFCLDQSLVYPTMGVTIGTKAFVAAVLGGIGSIPGAMLGGILIGVLGEMVKLTDYSGGVDVLVFVVLIAVLLVRPSGLLGSTKAEKV